MTTVTLTTDFGTSDGYVGAMKGVIIDRAPAARVVDIAHDIAAHDVVAGAYCLAQAAPYFPPGTIHVAVVDPGVGTERRPIIVYDGRSWFIGPDNGLLSLVAPAPQLTYAIEAAGFRRHTVSATFHGRDIFAAAAGALAAGARAEDAGPAVAALAALPGQAAAPPATVTAPGGATVIHIDRFGNLITDCPAQALPQRPRIRVGDRVIDCLSRTFGDVAPGELLAYVGSAGTLEIAVREASAARVLGIARGHHIEIRVA